ncbi:MAG: TetR family transcriptional regulator [Actinobacteria bacterium]|nr:TetR family transcriptional regulator [Actinomycetota bacterium]MBI3686723.1 TetR family transcriptional regulator [Actinomycetota bacterium]
MTLRERKQRRTRDTIVEAAIVLFAERGFDAVTITDIAHRAEIGRATFFRYFADKQEVLFADDTELLATLVAAIEASAATLATLGESLANALVVARAGLLALTRRVTTQPDRLALRARLIDAHPDLQARNLVKERGYTEAAVAAMTRHGAARDTAELAASLAAACFATGHARALATGQDLPSAVDAAFRTLTLLDTAVLRAGLDGQGTA